MAAIGSAAPPAPLLRFSSGGVVRNDGKTKIQKRPKVVQIDHMELLATTPPPIELQRPIQKVAPVADTSTEFDGVAPHPKDTRKPCPRNCGRMLRRDNTRGICSKCALKERPKKGGAAIVKPKKKVAPPKPAWGQQEHDYKGILLDLRMKRDALKHELNNVESAIAAMEKLA